MDIITLYPHNIDRRALQRAADALRQGGLVAYPTDTHTALAADSQNAKAIERLCRLKGVNPEKHTLTLVCDTISRASQYARIDNRAFSVMKRNLPGPFTFILPAGSSLPKVMKGRKEVGVRVPANAIARALVEELGYPLVSGSTDSDTDLEQFESQVALLIVDADADNESAAESSAIVDLTDSANPQILREGPEEMV